MSMELSETLIHRVQSFLTGKEAAQTTLVSKSWATAWSTRPTIDLEESDFHYGERFYGKYNIKIDGFTSFANKTFRRYEESNLSIDTFSLCLETGSYVLLGLAADWIFKALKLGATDLTFRFRSENIEPRRYRSHSALSQEYFDIPHTDVFASENVQRLCLSHLQIDGLKVINCTKLKSLTLIDFTLKTDQFCSIISCLPLIEFLSLSNIHSSNKKKVVRYPPKIILGKLRSLVLSGFQSQFQMKTLFLDDMLSKFPNLKDLTLGFISPDQQSYKPAEMIRKISSSTIETLNLRYDDSVGDIGKQKQERVRGVMIDVPGIRKFTFEGSCMPKLRFSPLPLEDQWDSHVLIRNHGDLSTKWFSELSEFLSKLKGSKVQLCLRLNFSKGFDYEVGGMDCLNVFEVDDLTLDTNDVSSMKCYAFLDALFRSCHPKMITQCIRPPLNDDEVYHHKIYPDRFLHEDRAKNTRNNDLFICRSIERAMPVKSVLLPTHFMYGLRDLEELDAQQIFDGVWKSLPLSSVLDDSISEKRRFRLQLKWKPSFNPYMRRPECDDDDDFDDVQVDHVDDDDDVDDDDFDDFQVDHVDDDDFDDVQVDHVDDDDDVGDDDFDDVQVDHVDDDDDVGDDDFDDVQVDHVDDDDDDDEMSYVNDDDDIVF